jgi:hypothetical protein
MAATRTQQANAETQSRLERARQLYHSFYPLCFWHCRRDLEITEAHIPMIIRGLREHGGRAGFAAAKELRSVTPAETCH